MQILVNTLIYNITNKLIKHLMQILLNKYERCLHYILKVEMNKNKHVIREDINIKRKNNFEMFNENYIK